MREVQNAQVMKSVRDMTMQEFQALRDSLTLDEIREMLAFLWGYAPDALDAGLRRAIRIREERRSRD